MKTKLLDELQKQGIPNFELFKTPEALAILPDLLWELLEQEKADFQTLIQKNNESLTFEDFVPESQLAYLWKIINHLDAVEASEEIRAIIADFRPKYEDFVNEVAYSQPYYQKILRASEHFEKNPDQQRWFDLTLKAFEQRGIALPAEEQAQLKNLNKQLSELGEKFQHNVVDEQSAFLLYFDDEEDFQEMPEELLAKMKALAGEKWGLAVNADPNLLVAVSKYCSNPEIRKQVAFQREQWASQGRFDNRPLALELLKLNQEKAKILGYANAGEMFLWATMAQDPDQVFDFIKPISAKAMQKAKSEVQTLQEYFQLSALPSYDLAYYTRKYKEEQYVLNDEELKQYFEFESVLKWLHSFVFKFLGVELRSRAESVFWSLGHERRYEVYHQGELVAYYMLDAFYRKGKRPWAWADYLREKGNGQLPIVVNVCNFQKAESWPSLLYLRDVETLFHEFGHALHAMLAGSPYAELSGFNVEWDFVELPSQLMENWVSDPEALKSLAKHYQTWLPMPEKLVQTLQDLKSFMMGNWVSRQNELALLDMTLYTSDIPNSVEELDQKILEIVNQYSIFPRGEEYKMYCAFLHIFGGSYEAKYYSYMRAELLEADVFQTIKKAWIFNPEIGSAYKEKILIPWTRKPAAELFFDFMQRGPSDEALMKKYGLLA